MIVSVRYNIASLATLAYSFAQGITVNAIAIDISERRRNTPRSKQVHQSMDTLRVILVEIPEHGIIWHIGLRVPLVASVHGRKFDGVPNKEDRKIIEDKILNTLLRIEFGCPTSDITNCVGRSLFSTDG